MGIPGIATVILGIFRFPFVTEPLRFKNTGTELKIPTAILHGNSDNIVKPSQWVEPPRSQGKTAPAVTEHRPRWRRWPSLTPADPPGPGPVLAGWRPHCRARPDQQKSPDTETLTNIETLAIPTRFRKASGALSL